jgi:hypothetical protein
MDELLLAKRDLVDKPYYYEHAFVWKECKPCCGSSLSNSFTRLYGIFYGRGDVATVHRTKMALTASDWCTWYPSISASLKAFARECLGLPRLENNHQSDIFRSQGHARIQSSSYSLEFESIDWVSSNEQREWKTTRQETHKANIACWEQECPYH